MIKTKDMISNSLSYNNLSVKSNCKTVQYNIILFAEQH